MTSQRREPGILRLFRIVQVVEGWVLSASILLMAAFTIANVVSRTLFNTSLAFAEELSQFLIILVCFVGLSYAASQGRHIRMTAIYDALSVKHRKIVMVSICVLTSALLFFLAWHAGRYVHTVYLLGGISPALRVPFYLVYLAAPLGLILAGVQYAMAALRNLTSPDVYLSYEYKDEYEEPLVQEI